MPTQYFTTEVTLPHTDCTEEDIYNLCRTIKPIDGALVDGNTFKTDPTTGAIVPGNFTPAWRKYTKTFTQLSQAALTFDVELFQLPAGGVLHVLKLKHSQAFTGGAISAYTLSIGIGSNLTKYMAARSVFSAATTADFSLVCNPFFNYLAASALATLFTTYTAGMEDQTTPTSIRLAATSVGANLSAATAGSVDVWALYSTAV